MKKILNIVIVIAFIVIFVNIFLFYTSSSYNDFLTNLKHNNDPDGWDIIAVDINDEKTPKSTKFWSFELTLSKDNSKEMFVLDVDYGRNYNTYEAKSWDLEMYVFTDSSYNDILEFYKLTSFVTDLDRHFKVDDNDFFKDRSFFVNLDEKDDKIRFIFEKNNKILWIMVDRDKYNIVRDILNNN